MNREDKIKAFSMRLDGFTFQEIGEHLGVPKMAVQQMLQRAVASNGTVYRKWVYPNIRDWVMEQGLSLSQISQICGLSANSVSSYMTGKLDPPFSFIKAVLKASGMSFEEAFFREDPVESGGL